MKAIRCKCGCLYPDDMEQCPTCQRATQGNMDHVISESKHLGSGSSDPSTWKPVKMQAAYEPKDGALKFQRERIALILCSACNHKISVKAEICPNCGNPTGVHVCPKCNGINTKVISGASKSTSVFLWGVFATNKVLSKYECKDCGHRF